MKINPVHSSFCNYTVKKKNTMVTSPDSSSLMPVSDSYMRAAVAFQGIKESVINAKFDDKLAVALNKMKNSPFDSHLLFVAKDLKTIKEHLDEVLEASPAPIRKLFLMFDERLEETLIFAKVESDINLINLNNFGIITGGLETLYPDETIYVSEGDKFRSASLGWFEIKYKPNSDIDLEKYSPMFLKSYDYNDELEKLTLKHNKKISADITTEKKQSQNDFGFTSVGGQDSVIDALKKNILFPLKYPEVFEGFMVSRGAILYGPPGTGKTLIAKALASESGASVFELCATELADKWVGGSEKNCRELFSRAIDAQPSIIYMDEIEALGKTRGNDVHGDKLLTQFLSLMSDLEKNGDKVFVIGSTNRKEDLDPAFTRSGRFSTLLEVKNPDLDGVKQIFDIHLKDKPVDDELEKTKIAIEMHKKHMSGADIASIVKEAFSNSLERTGIYKSMDENRFSPAMKDMLTITNEDFFKAIAEFKQDTKKRNPIGYNK